MRINPKLEKYRTRTGLYGSATGDDFGAFQILGPRSKVLRIIASPGDSLTGVEWEHVSVSLVDRCPTWDEMCFVKDLFWDAEEAVMQLHPPKSDYVNMHPYCLHLWKPTRDVIPLPPSYAVGLKSEAY